MRKYLKHFKPYLKRYKKFRQYDFFARKDAFATSFLQRATVNSVFVLTAQEVTQHCAIY
jgi:hypothetical protein